MYTESDVPCMYYNNSYLKVKDYSLQILCATL